MTATPMFRPRRRALSGRRETQSLTLHAAKQSSYGEQNYRPKPTSHYLRSNTAPPALLPRSGNLLLPGAPDKSYENRNR
jgi:hypothetical protein